MRGVHLATCSVIPWNSVLGVCLFLGYWVPLRTDLFLKKSFQNWGNNTSLFRCQLGFFFLIWRWHPPPSLPPSFPPFLKRAHLPVNGTSVSSSQSLLDWRDYLQREWIYSLGAGCSAPPPWEICYSRGQGVSLFSLEISQVLFGVDSGLKAS